jgi:hypothetical protein
MFAVKNQDIYTFTHEASHVFYWFAKEKRPNFIGTTPYIHTEESVLEGDGWRVAVAKYEYPHGDSPGRGCFVVMGNVAYRLDVSKFGNVTAGQSSLLKTNLHIIVPIGAVEPAANRENLSLTRKSIDVIKQRLAKIENEIVARFRSEIDAEPSWWHACIKRKQMVAEMSHQIRFLVESASFDWQGKQLVKKLPIANKLTCYERYTNRKGDTSSKKLSEENVHPVKSSAFIVVNGPSFLENKIRSWVRKNQNGFSAAFIVNETFVKTHDIPAEFVFKQTDLPDLSDKKPKSPGLPRKTVDEAYRKDISSYDKGKFSAKQRTKVDFKDGKGFYVPIVGKTCMLDLVQIDLNELCQLCERINHVLKEDDKVKHIFGFTATQIDKIDPRSGWKEISEYLKEKLKEVMDRENDILELYYSEWCVENLKDDVTIAKRRPGEIKSQTFQKVLLLLDKNHPVVKYVEMVEKIESSAKQTKKLLEESFVNRYALKGVVLDYTVRSIIHNYEAQLDRLDTEASEKYKNLVKDLLVEEEEIFKKYPHLGFLFDRHVNAESIAKILESSV